MLTHFPLAEGGVSYCRHSALLAGTAQLRRRCKTHDWLYDPAVSAAWYVLANRSEP